MKQSFPGISPLAKDITQKYLKTHQEFQVQNTSLKLTCVILVVVVVFNTMFSALLVYKNALMAEENLQLIQENQALMGKSSSNAVYLSINTQHNKSEGICCRFPSIG